MWAEQNLEHGYVSLAETAQTAGAEEEPAHHTTDYHRIPIETLYARFGSHPTEGLSDEQAERNKESYGKNLRTPPKEETVPFIKFVSRLQLTLLTNFILTFFMFSWNLISGERWGFYLFLSIVFAGTFVRKREKKCEIWKHILEEISTQATCIRNGQLQEMDASELVVGDIVKVEFGDTIPADIRIIDASGFKVDRSLITGDSIQQLGTSECTSENPAETRNLAFFPATVLKGNAKGIVVSVGDDMFIGRVSALASGLESRDSPLAKEVQQLAIWLLVAAVFFGVAFSVCTLELGYGFMTSVVFLINIIVANLPLGLSETLTGALTLTTKRMIEKNIVAKLRAVEALGSTTVMCFDKTGTLTWDRLTVRHLWFGNELHQVKEGVQFDAYDAGFPALARVATLCSRGLFFGGQVHLPVKQRKVDGDATETAILRCMGEYSNVGFKRVQWPKVFEIPFSSENKWQLSIHETILDGRKKNLLVMKGAPDRILAYCNKDVSGPMEEDDKSKVLNGVCKKLSGMGERIIAFCDLELPEDEYPIGFKFTAENAEYLKLGLRFVGLMSMADSLRPFAVEAVKSCRAAGIKVVMVTGDHPSTAKAIAKDVGIICTDPEPVEERANDIVELAVDADANESIVVNGEELMKFSTEQLDEVLRNHKQFVFARVSPQQKLLIVEGFQRLNEVVAMVGDGVNDVAALKKADVGIALGISGSEVSKEAANLILLDDNLESIVAGVAEGRLMFVNLKRSFRYLLSTNVALLIPLILFVTFNIPLPLGTSHMLMLCIATGLVNLPIIMALQDPEEALMEGPPRNLNKINLINVWLGVIQSLAGMFAYLVVMGDSGFLPWDLFGLRDAWDSRGINDLRDSYGHEWTYVDRKHLEHTCWTAYFWAAVVCRWGALNIPRTAATWKVMLGSVIVVEAVIACILTLIPMPGMDGAAVSLFQLKFIWWLPGVPFCLFTVVSHWISSCFHSAV